MIRNSAKTGSTSLIYIGINTTGIGSPEKAAVDDTGPVAKDTTQTKTEPELQTENTKSEIKNDLNPGPHIKNEPKSTAKVKITESRREMKPSVESKRDINLTAGVYKVPYNFIFFPTLIFFLNLIFFTKFQSPSPIPH